MDYTPDAYDNDKGHSVLVGGQLWYMQGERGASVMVFTNYDTRMRFTTDYSEVPCMYQAAE